MNTKIILTIGATALLASSLLAFNGQGNMKQGYNSGYNQQKMMKGQKTQRGHGIIKIFMRLDLSDEQRTKIRAIVKQSMTTASNPKDAFTQSSFDKKAFVKLANERRDGKIQRRADTIEKVYAVLNDTQKKDFKTMLDMREIMRKNMMIKGNCNAQNCNGRRR